MLLQALKEEFSPLCLLKHAGSSHQAQAGGRLLWGTGPTGDTALANGAASPCVLTARTESFPSAGRRCEGNFPFAEENQWSPVWVCGRWEERRSICYVGS